MHHRDGTTALPEALSSELSTCVVLMGLILEDTPDLITCSSTSNFFVHLGLYTTFIFFKWIPYPFVCFSETTEI